MIRIYISILASALFLLPSNVDTSGRHSHKNVRLMSINKQLADISFKHQVTLTENEKPEAAQFSFAKHFQDHMVLQKAPARAKIYGFSPGLGQKVDVVVNATGYSKHYETTVRAGHSPGTGIGVWSVLLDPLTAGNTVTIRALSQGVQITITDVIYGDVWLCSGQSNMQFTTIQMLEAAEEIADAHNYPDVRIMTVYEKTAATPLADLLKIQQNWTRPDNTSVGGPAWKYFSAVCWLYGKGIHKELGYPIGLVATDWGGTPVEAWSSPEALAECGIHSTTRSKQPASFLEYVNTLPLKSRRLLLGPDNNSALWNAMIYPFLNMTIYGAIWYQGEADASGTKMNKYNCTFPTMIKDWRKNFHQASEGQTNATFPFGFVQLAANSPSKNITLGFPDIRWHQTGDRGYVPNSAMENVFMAVALDLPDFNSTYGSIHPRDKKDVGERLILSGLAVAYGRSEVFQGPFPKQGQVISEGLKMMYGDKWNLEVRNTEGFELQCTNNIWVPAPVIGSDSTSVTIKLNVCPSGETIKGIRYEWRESPCEFKKCAVYEKVNGLPGPPFIILDNDNIDGKPWFKFGGPVHI